MIPLLQPSPEALHGTRTFRQTAAVAFPAGNGQQFFLLLPSRQFPEQFPFHGPVPAFYKSVKHSRHPPVVGIPGPLVPDRGFPVGEVKHPPYEHGQEQCPQNGQPAKHDQRLPALF